MIDFESRHRYEGFRDMQFAPRAVYFQRLKNTDGLELCFE
jgi:hypothetical protein